MATHDEDPGPDIAHVNAAMREHDQANPPPVVPRPPEHGARSGIDEDPDGPELPPETARP